jgi:hypothetical protein
MPGRMNEKDVLARQRPVGPRGRANFRIRAQGRSATPRRRPARGGSRSNDKASNPR